MASYTLQDLNDALNRKFGPTSIELEDGKAITLLPVLRLSKTQRDALRAAQESAKKISEIDEDSDEVDEDAVVNAARERLETIIKIVSENEQAAYAALGWCGGDIAKLQTLIGIWNEDQKPGEASPSQN